MEILFKKVVIKSEKDLPKKDGEYICKMRDRIHPVAFHKNISEKFDDYWLDIDWYLQPVDTAEIVDIRLDLLEEEATYMYLKLVKMYSDLVYLCETSQYHEVIRAKSLLKDKIAKLKKELNIE